MTQNLFGTDGVRGVANLELDCTTAFRLGQGAVHVYGPRVVIGRDTRRSGTMLESALMAGIMSAGGDALACGVIPTPAVAYLVSAHDADCGVVISASHNPPEYNGIKFFGSDGMKATDEAEDELSKAVLEPLKFEPPVGEGVGRLIKLSSARDEYISHAISTIDVDLQGLTIALDCAHGASCVTSPAALERLGACVHAFNTDFNGLDINVNCGSTHLEQLQRMVQQTGADIGIAHDGDADRVLFVDEHGNEVDGDFVLAICARSLLARDALPKREVVSTVMCNLGFVRAMEALDVHVVQTAVGDRYVLAQMCEDGAVLGGEQSGHIIFLEHNTTGDGLVTALQLLAEVKRSGKPLSELACVMKRFPQALVNVRTARKDEHATDPEILSSIREQEAKLADNGRILVRASGTEPLVRVMVEAATEALAHECANTIASVVRTRLDGE